VTPIDSNQSMVTSGLQEYTPLPEHSRFQIGTKLHLKQLSLKVLQLLSLTPLYYLKTTSLLSTLHQICRTDITIRIFKQELTHIILNVEILLLMKSTSLLKNTLKLQNTPYTVGLNLNYHVMESQQSSDLLLTYHLKLLQNMLTPIGMTSVISRYMTENLDTMS